MWLPQQPIYLLQFPQEGFLFGLCCSAGSWTCQQHPGVQIKYLALLFVTPSEPLVQMERLEWTVPEGKIRLRRVRSDLGAPFCLQQWKWGSTWTALNSAKLAYGLWNYYHLTNLSYFLPPKRNILLWYCWKTLKLLLTSLHSEGRIDITSCEQHFSICPGLIRLTAWIRTLSPW